MLTVVTVTGLFADLITMMCQRREIIGVINASLAGTGDQASKGVLDPRWTSNGKTGCGGRI